MDAKKNKKSLSDSYRRQYPRLTPEAVPLLKCVRFGQESEAQVVNISRGGILLETEAALRPLMKILLKFVTNTGTIKIEGRILRSSIISLKGIPRFRTAIAFEHPFHMLDGLSAQSAGQKEAPPFETPAPDATDSGSDQPLLEPDNPGGIINEEPIVLTVIAQEMFMKEMFELNDW